MPPDIYIHPSAEVSESTQIGTGSRIWHQAQIRENVTLGRDCIVGKGVYIDEGVKIGSNCKIQNGVSLYKGVTLEDGVFCGPHCVFTNDLRPRAITPDGNLRGIEDWTVEHTLVKEGASVGANAVIVCGVVIGGWAMIGAGSVVTKDVPEFGLVYGNPARLYGFVCKCGAAAGSPHRKGDKVTLECTECHAEIEVPQAIFDMIMKME